MFVFALVGSLFCFFVLFVSFSVGIVTAYRTLYWSCLSSLLKSTIVKMHDVFALINHLIEFVNMQMAYRHDERPGESYEALDGKKDCFQNETSYKHRKTTATCLHSSSEAPDVWP